MKRKTGTEPLAIQDYMTGQIIGATDARGER